MLAPHARHAQALQPPTASGTSVPTPLSVTVDPCCSINRGRISLLAKYLCGTQNPRRSSFLTKDYLAQEGEVASVSYDSTPSLLNKERILSKSVIDRRATKCVSRIAVAIGRRIALQPSMISKSSEWCCISFSTATCPSLLRRGESNGGSNACGFACVDGE